MITAVVMPEPSDSKRMVLTERDTAGELAPQIRKGGRLRYVNQKVDGRHWSASNHSSGSLRYWPCSFFQASYSGRASSDSG